MLFYYRDLYPARDIDHIQSAFAAAFVIRTADNSLMLLQVSVMICLHRLQVSVQPGGCFTGDDWLVPLPSPEGVKPDQDVTRLYAQVNASGLSLSPHRRVETVQSIIQGFPSACLMPLASLRFSMTAYALIRLDQNLGHFPLPTLYGI